MSDYPVPPPELHPQFMARWRELVAAGVPWQRARAQAIRALDPGVVVEPEKKGQMQLL